MYAAFFAVQSALNKTVPPESLCVWAYNSSIRLCGTFIGHKDYKEDASKMTLDLWKRKPVFQDWAQFNYLEDDPSRNQYLKAQKGIFVEIDNAELFYIIHNRWPSMEDYLDPQFVEFPEGISDDEYPKPVLIKHVLAQSKFEELSIILEREGISQAGLMPTLDNVANDVIVKWNRASL